MPSNRVSLQEVIRILISGGKLEWQEHSGHAAGDISLDSAEKRRLFGFFKSRDSSEIEDPSEEIFQGLIDAWQAEDDPAEAIPASTDEALASDQWKLDEIITYGFGGLNQFEGPKFKVKINQETWCIEGQNGSGKTSLTSAIIWALTGQVVREHTGLVQSDGERKPVFSNNGTKIGSWPPIAAYPTDENDLAKTANIYVKLIFRNASGDKATVYRRLRSKPDGSELSHLAHISSHLRPYTNLIEAGVVMPSRLGHLGFAERSENLSDAVKMLTGLDFLESIGQGVAKMKRGNSRFLNYAKQQRIGDIEAEYSKWIDVAKGHAEATGYDFEPIAPIDAEGLAEKLEELRVKAEEEASNKMGALVDDLASNINVDTQQGRDRVKQAVERIKADITKKPTDLSPMFGALATLSEAQKNNELVAINSVLESVESELQLAMKWHKKQLDDSKLQLKAEAALLAATAELSHCPLCEGELQTPEQKALATELSELKENAEAAKKKLSDVCNTVSTKITNAIPRSLQPKLTQLEIPDIKSALLVDIRSSFVDSSSFSVVEGLKKLLEAEIEEKWEALPSYQSGTSEVSNSDEPQCVQEVRQKANQVARILSVAEWWAGSRAEYWNFWKGVIGQPLADSNDLAFPDSVIGERLEVISRSLSTAKPFDETAKALKNAIEKEGKWREINEQQKMRENIAKAIEPLALLVPFVNTETSRSIDSLSSRIGDVLRRIHLHERLDYKDTAFVKGRKSTVNVHGSFNGGDFKIDATLVANTSWLRAILWAFIFSLREEIVTALGFNPFPLIVMDDPQVTFDPKNERLWATEIVRLSNSSEADQAQFCCSACKIDPLEGQISVQF